METVNQTNPQGTAHLPHVVDDRSSRMHDLPREQAQGHPPEEAVNPNSQEGWIGEGVVMWEPPARFLDHNAGVVCQMPQIPGSEMLEQEIRESTTPATWSPLCPLLTPLRPFALPGPRQIAVSCFADGVMTTCRWLVAMKLGKSQTTLPNGMTLTTSS